MDLHCPLAWIGSPAHHGMQVSSTVRKRLSGASEPLVSMGSGADGLAAAVGNKSIGPFNFSGSSGFFRANDDRCSDGEGVCLTGGDFVPFVHNKEQHGLPERGGGRRSSDAAPAVVDP